MSRLLDIFDQDTEMNRVSKDKQCDPQVADFACVARPVFASGGLLGAGGAPVVWST
jgi:hypothetical protein